MTNLEELTDFLTQRGVKFELTKIEWGQCVRVATGEIVNVYDSGKVVVQGKKTALNQELQAFATSGMQPSVSEVAVGSASEAVTPSSRVFIVYGHDKASRDGLELMLLKMGMEPIILGDLPAAGDTIIEKLEAHLKASHNVGFACVLLTPDDEGHRAGQPKELAGRARQNVILELGMFLARLGRSRVAIIYNTVVEKPSDIDGLLYLGFKKQVDEVKMNLFKELKAAGYSPNVNAL
jgi:predicted nucleotide-binding protein